LLWPGFEKPNVVPDEIVLILRHILECVNRDAIAAVDAKGIFHAGISNYTVHDVSMSWNELFRLRIKRRKTSRMRL